MIETVLGYLVGLIVGLIMGMLGGGGSLLLPAMLYLLHFDLKFATAYTTILVGVTALAGTLTRFQKKDLIDKPTVLALGIPVSLGMLLVRLWLFDVVPDQLFSIGSLVVTKKMFVLTLFAGLLFLSFATLMGWIGKNVKSNAGLRDENPVVYYSTLIVSGLLIGILPGFSGAGGGVLIVPLLVILFGLPMQTVVGTSLAIVAMKSFVGFCGGDAVRLGSQIDYGFLLRFSVLMMIGVVIGSKFSSKIDPHILRIVFAWFIFGLGVFMIMKEVIF
ncbi:MAG: putative membrane protein YfcA [Mariniblastus sp.]|jgi:uncharacterized membrane protein YfcA